MTGGRSSFYLVNFRLRHCVKFSNTIQMMKQSTGR
jgi:hypothetical protein